MDKISLDSALATILNETDSVSNISNELLKNGSQSSNKYWYIPIMDGNGYFYKKVSFDALVSYLRSASPMLASPYYDEEEGMESNPLPTDINKYSEVKIDGIEVSTVGGTVEVNNLFDTIGVKNIGDDHSVVFVPTGSTLGANDNIALAANVIQNEDYAMNSTDTSSGTVYVDGSIWFRVNVVAKPAFSNDVKLNNAATLTDISGKSAVIDWPFTSAVIYGTNMQNASPLIKIRGTGLIIQPTEITTSSITFTIDPSLSGRRSIFDFYKSSSSGLWFAVSFPQDYYYEQVGGYEE